VDLKLTNKVALVTGGSRGIGVAIVRSLLAEGAKVANVNLPGTEGEQLASELGENYAFIEADLCDAAACEQAVARTIDCFGGIDIVVNNAGVNDSAGLDAGVDAFTKSLQRNLNHYYAIVHHAREELKKSHGAIVNVGSKVAVTGQGGTSGYAAAKGAVNSLTREWAVELAPFGVRCNAVLPAEAWTPMYDQWLSSLPNADAVKADIENLIPLGRRFTTCEELANMIVFLASPISSHTTGQIIHVDGGYTHFDRKATAGGIQATDYDASKT
jgi:NAD(P)-dependent dehydrogenase (short-subunit alcohol dehydrogenase family)